MSRFCDVLKGTRAIKRVEVPYGDDAIICGIRALSADEEAEAHAVALAYAAEKGVKSATTEDPAYLIGLRSAVLFRSCVDVDSESARYFDSEAQIRGEIDPDRIALIYEQQEQWQAHASPRASKMSGEEWTQGVVACAQGVDEAERFFTRLAPVLRASFLHTTASQLWISLLDKSAFGSTAATSGMS